MSEILIPSPSEPQSVNVDGVDYFTAKDCSRFLEVEYQTVLNLQKYHGRLEGRKVGATLFITCSSAREEKRRRTEKAVAV